MASENNNNNADIEGDDITTVSLFQEDMGNSSQFMRGDIGTNNSSSFGSTTFDMKEEEENELTQRYARQKEARIRALREEDNRNSHEMYLNAIVSGSLPSQSNLTSPSSVHSFDMSELEACLDSFHPMNKDENAEDEKQGEEGASLSNIDEDEIESVDYSRLDRFGFIVIPPPAPRISKTEFNSNNDTGNSSNNNDNNNNNSNKETLLSERRTDSGLKSASALLNRLSSSFSDGDNEEDRIKKDQNKVGKKEAKRAVKWIEMLKILEKIKDVSFWTQTHKKFEERLVKGIPDCLRAKVWALFLQVPFPSQQQSLELSTANINGKGNVAGTTMCTDRSSPIGDSSAINGFLGMNGFNEGVPFKELYMKISGYERQIDLDIERTLRDHIMFKARFSSAQVSLFKILVAYSNYDPEVGYCQGMSTIAAFLLLYFEEEIAFCMMKRLMRRNQVRLFFTTGFPMLFETFYVQEMMMKKYMPALLARLTAMHISTSVYATKWYLTLFLGFPFSLATRIWDLFLYWGPDMLISVSLALLKINETRLLNLEYEGCMQFISKLSEGPIDERRLIQLTWAIWKRVYPDYSRKGSWIDGKICIGAIAGSGSSSSGGGSSNSNSSSRSGSGSGSGNDGGGGRSEDDNNPFTVLRTRYGKMSAVAKSSLKTLERPFMD